MVAKIVNKRARRRFVMDVECPGIYVRAVRKNSSARLGNAEHLFQYLFGMFDDLKHTQSQGVIEEVIRKRQFARVTALKINRQLQVL